MSTEAPSTGPHAFHHIIRCNARRYLHCRLTMGRKPAYISLYTAPWTMEYCMRQQSLVPLQTIVCLISVFVASCPSTYLSLTTRSLFARSAYSKLEIRDDDVSRRGEQPGGPCSREGAQKGPTSRYEVRCDNELAMQTEVNRRRLAIVSVVIPRSLAAASIFCRCAGERNSASLVAAFPIHSEKCCGRE